MSTSIYQEVQAWFKRRFSHPEAVALLLTIVFGVLLLDLLGGYVLPALVSVVLAYLLMPLVQGLQHCRIPRWLAVTIVYCFFIGLVLALIVFFMPFLWRQLTALVDSIPQLVSSAKSWLMGLSHQYPTLLPADATAHLSDMMTVHASSVGKAILSTSLSGIPGIITVILYFILVPILVLFFLTDSATISQYILRYLPQERGLIVNVWMQINQQFAAYIRARVIEVVIVSIIAIVCFLTFGLPYAVLLGFFVGISCVVPYVGAVVAAIPVVVLGMMSWGLGMQTVYLIGAYFIICALDSYVITPWLFSETLALHPMVIIVSILLFGGLFGFWGVFFAIPLVLVIRILMDSWPSATVVSEG